MWTAGCELAREHDGFLRGRAEPVVLLVIFGTSGASARLLARGIARAEVGVVPGIAALTEKVDVRGSTRDARIGLLAVALEEDGGADIARLYAAAEDLARFRVWTDAEVPAPITVDELARALEPRVPTRVALLVDDRDVGIDCKADDFIGAICLAADVIRGAEEARFRFVSADGTNDWTLIVGVKFS